MNAIDDIQIDTMAKACVKDMGDIFWDYNAERDAARAHRDPSEVAVESVVRSLKQLATALNRDTVLPRARREEYQTLVGELGDSPSDMQITVALVGEAAWTESGSALLVKLARQYGTFVLSNALALAEALDIEDGEAGY